MRFSTVAVPCFVLATALFAGAPAPSFAAPSIGTAPPPVGTVPNPTLGVPQIVSFKNYVGPSGISEQFYKGGPFKFAVEVKNTTNAALQKKLELRRVSGNSSIVYGSAVVSAAAGQTVTTVIESSHIAHTCAPNEWSLVLEGVAPRAARTTSTCTYTATSTDPWAGLSAAEVSARQRGKFSWYGPTITTPVCGQKIKTTVMAKNDTATAQLAGFSWHPLSRSDRSNVAKGSTRIFEWETLQPWDGATISGHVLDLSPYAQDNVPLVDRAPRLYQLTMAKSCTMASALVN